MGKTQSFVIEVQKSAEQGIKSGREAISEQDLGREIAKLTARYRELGQELAELNAKMDKDLKLALASLTPRELTNFQKWKAEQEQEKIILANERKLGE